MEGFTPTEAQRRAITTLDGPLFVAAGAGSGKTGVVTRRYVHAISSGFATVDQILTITFTRKAAAEMMERIRDLLRRRQVIDGDPDEGQLERMEAAYRDIERAAISTIDSFCASLLRANALAAGIDPDFRAADEVQAGVMRDQAFQAALQRLVEEEGEGALALINAYDPGLSGSLMKTITGAYDTLRSQGREPRLTLPDVKPDPEAAALNLRAAIDDARAAAMAREDPKPKTVAEGLESLEKLDQALRIEGEAGLAPVREGRPTGNFGKLRDEFKAVQDGVDFYLLQFILVPARRTLELFDRLLASFGQEYESIKRAEGILDFADLSLTTRRLLSDEDIRRRVAGRYRLVMVDEFQDTNPLQHGIIRLVAGEGNLFVVGDENQSIYGFRDADVTLFQREKEKAAAEGRLVLLDRNFRSQRPILGFVDHIFSGAGMLGDGYLKLEAAAEPDGRGEDCRLELILVDEGRKSKSENLEKVPKDVAIRAEARVIAERLRQLFDGAAGEPYRPGDTALLLRTATHAEEYRDALAGCGIDSYLSIGSRYFDKLELADIIAFLKLVVNPLDDIAMLAVLRSPFVGLSDDELFLLRLAAGPGGRGEALWPFISRLPGAASSAGGWASPEAGELDQALHSRLVFFREGLDRLRRSAGREPLEVLIRRLIDHNDYAAVLASAADGRQRLANLDLLMDLAADFEEVWGRDVAGLARFLQQQQERKPRQAEAPIEEEGVDAVRIMTMHAAKGLQFPLVVLPDLGNTGNSRNDSIIRLDRRQLGRIGLKYRDSSSAGEKVFQFEELEEEDLERERREEKRLGYVAMTRARSHLIMSGIAPVDRGPGSKKKRSPALDWLRDILHLKRERTGEDITEFLDVNGVPVRFHVCARIRQLARRYGEDVVRRKSAAVEPLDPDLGRVPPAASFVPPVISASALDTLASCPRRYYFQHVCRADRLMARQRQPAAGGEQPGEGLQPWEKGTLVHAILERAPDLGRIDPERATGDDLDALAGELLEPGWSIGPGDRDDISRLLGNLGASPSVARLREAAEKGDLAREFPFRTLLGDTTILNGAIDALALLDGSVLVVDYKTGGAGEDGVEEAASHYRMQMTAYALAASRLYPGRAVDVALVFLEQPGLEATVSYREEETGSLQRRLEKLIDSLSDASFPPLDAYDEYHCTWCPGGPGGADLCPVGAAAAGGGAHRLPPG